MTGAHFALRKYSYHAKVQKFRHFKDILVAYTTSSNTRQRRVRQPKRQVEGEREWDRCFLARERHVFAYLNFPPTTLFPFKGMPQVKKSLHLSRDYPSGT